jgi:hypothetical protein
MYGKMTIQGIIRPKNMKGMDNLGHLGVGDRIILKWTFVNVWTGLIWRKIKASDNVKGEKFID